MLLDAACHSWAHANPVDAIAEGFIVPTWIDNADIAAQPIEVWRGRTTLTAAGNYGPKLT